MISSVQYHYHEGSPMSKEAKLRWERFIEEVGFEPGVKEWRSDGWWEWQWWEGWVDRWMKRWIETGLTRLTKWIWKLIPERWCMNDLWFAVRRWLVGRKGNNRWGMGIARGFGGRSSQKGYKNIVNQRHQHHRQVAQPLWRYKCHESQTWQQETKGKGHTLWLVEYMEAWKLENERR